MEREPISKALRFEVFKRDKFTCQYCGGKSPDIVLNVDHIRPVADGGKSDILNLVTSCQPCNSGKGARLLTDESVVERQRQQIEELEERRQQLVMMLEWRDELANLDRDVVQAVCDHIAARGRFLPNENGKQDIRRWLKRFSVDEILTAADASMDSYLEFKGDDVTDESWNKAFSKIPSVASIKQQEKTKPYLRDLFYVQGILRKRTRIKWLKCVEYLESAIEADVPVSFMMETAKRVDTWEEFDQQIDSYILSETN